MVSVVLTRDSEGRLKSVSAEGHAFGGAFGKDPVCAAISFLLRSVALSLGHRCKVEAKKRGSFSLSIEKTCVLAPRTDELTMFLQSQPQKKTTISENPQTLANDELGFELFASRILEIGFRSLELEHPDKVQLEVITLKD